MSASVVAWLDQRWYGDVRSHWDDDLLRTDVVRRLRPEHVILDLGAGSGRVTAMNFKGLVYRSIGVDLDPAIASNRQIHAGCLGTGERLPFADGAFDLVIADNVLEHLDAPGLVFSEVQRVLKPGGRFLFKTPNARHYVTLIARLTPHAFHQWVNKRRGRAEEDTFPTRYRANTASAVRRLAATAGLVVGQLRAIEGRPEYARVHPVSYLVGRLYERAVNNVPLGEHFRLVLLGELVKPVTASHLGGRHAR
jgi:SAM-dependent methyltransferase